MKFFILFTFVALTYSSTVSVNANNAQAGKQEEQTEAAAEKENDILNEEFTQQQLQHCENFRVQSLSKVHLNTVTTEDGNTQCLGVRNKAGASKFCAECESEETQVEQNQCKTCKAKVGEHGDHIPTCGGPAEADQGPNHFCKVPGSDKDGVPTKNGCVYKPELCQYYSDNKAKIPASPATAVSAKKQSDTSAKKKSPEVALGQFSSSDNLDPEDLKIDCGPYDQFFDDFDPNGFFTCNRDIAKMVNTGNSFGGYADIYCFVDKNKPEFFSAQNPNGKCDCVQGKQLGTDGRCHEFFCSTTTEGPGCRVCANPLTRNYECKECNEGYILYNGDCLEAVCSEDPDSWEWHGCQECRMVKSRRHPQDCLICAHGYHFLHEQRHLPNQTDTDSFSTQKLVVQGEESGYCFPYNCVAGGNLHNIDAYAAFAQGIRVTSRAVNITKVLVTDHLSDNMDPSVPVLGDDVYAFRDHCRTCVPQQKRLKDDHCETCNPGYYLDEMHHTCRKKTCGVPHFRRNAISCTKNNLKPLPWSTPCTDCLDNAPECCVVVEPVMTCGAQSVFCHLGTHRVGYATIDCTADGCPHLSDLCCEPKTCDNQKVACHPGQIRNEGSTECTLCIHADTDCCTESTDTCGLHDVKCGHGQNYLGPDTTCEDCSNGSLDCCEPIQKTCQNQNVFCHLGTYRDNSAGPITCTDCEHYGDVCCETPTCQNQRVPCTPGRKRIPDNECLQPGDCVMDSDNCCEPLPPIEETCGNQHVKCEPRMYKPHGTPCNTGEKGNNCDDYGLTCCEEKTCANQGVGCSILQAPLAGDTTCTSCADNGNECCSDNKTCGLMGVQCKTGFYRSPLTECTTCDHHGTECCVDVEMTCMNQGTICLPSTYKPMGTECEDCSHYGEDCCDKPTCGNQNVSCLPGSEMMSGDTECGDQCYHGSPKCCADVVKTCHNQGVKCMDGHYLADQSSIECGDDCTHNGATCCTVWKKTCGNQNVVCSADQTYVGADQTCTDCENHSAPCCEAVTKTCANQGVVCRSEHYATGYGEGEGIPCENEGCLNDALPCCVPLTKTCGNQSVVCSADQTYMAPTTECGAECINYGSKCCEDVPKTCANQRVMCEAGHYADGYGSDDGILCGDSSCKSLVAPCCKPVKSTCGQMNTKCDPKTQKPMNPQTECDGDQCNNNSDTCCMDVTQTCANQGVVCRAGHYAENYGLGDGIPCGAEGCLNDDSPCCVPLIKTCGNQHVQCAADQTQLDPTNTCTTCTREDTKCCENIEATCMNQGVVCRPGFYKADQGLIACNGLCEHHGSQCCEDWEKTCGNQNVMCKCGQSYELPTQTCNDCVNGGTECCSDDKHTCSNQQIMCAPGHYASDYMDKDCESVGCMHDAEPCCTPFPSTCGNQNVQCGRNRIAVNPSTPCDGDQCNTDSDTCCTDVTATCMNQGVVCRPGHYVPEYKNKECVVENSEGVKEDMCCNDQDHCCIPFVRTCQNQNVRCGYGLEKKHMDDKLTALECTDCTDYSDECCDNVNRTCGKHGVNCRQDLYMPADTECQACDAEQCCKPIPVTCASDNYSCPLGHYLPGDRVCPDGRCDDSVCCHPVKTTCANQAVQCHEGHYKEKLADLECGDCLHYGDECCEGLTCKSAGVFCDKRYFLEVSDFETRTCEGEEEGCRIASDLAPCCQPKSLQATSPTCRNIYGISAKDKSEWPFLLNFENKVVRCDVSQGYYYRLDADGSPADNVCSDPVSQSDNGSSCSANDSRCCWRKTCAGNLDNNSGLYNDGMGIEQDGLDVTCPTGTTLKDNPQYIVCSGDCIADCCVPDDTCSSARVACSHGYERVADWDHTACGDDCVENSVKCCQRTSCNNVPCDDTKFTHNGDALCFDCHADGPECCKPIEVADTCSNQRVHCGYGFYKRSDYNSPTKTCESCLDDGTECCVKKTCDSRSIAGDMVTCSGGFENRSDRDRKECYTCVDNGAECCQPVVPAKTCTNQNVVCTFGYFHKVLAVGEEDSCKTCLTNGDECCTQRTCANPDGQMNAVTCGDDQISKMPETPCTLCMDNTRECCTAKPTCWSSQVVCPLDRYHKHPNTVCGDNCDVEHCCAIKTCANQGVCCNEKLGFSKKDGFDSDDSILCDDCADNCDQCCSFNAPTCKTAKVGCGFGYHRKPNSDDTECDTCALNDLECCVPKTCGAEMGIDAAVDCGEDHTYLGDDKPCHFCGMLECCRPKEPKPTCRSENINCGMGLKFDVASADKECDTCVQNDAVCCKPTTCDGFDCGDGFKCRDGRSCAFCEHHECCERIATCASAGVGCGFGYRVRGDQSVECETCQLNDNACCEAKTCANTDVSCPSGFEKIDTDKSCAFCETSECCAPVIPEKTCGNVPVVCGHGFKPIEANADSACGTCEKDHPVCCARDKCTEDICNSMPGFHRKMTVTDCGICSVEECCAPDVPDKTCANQQVGCGFGYKYKPNPELNGCDDCTLNDGDCCDQKMCNPDGPVCSQFELEGVAFSPRAENVPCTVCDDHECCVPPVITKTCVNQSVVCSGEYRNNENYLNPDHGCDTCLPNDLMCCQRKTCGNSGATCNRDLFTPKDDMENTKCMVCASNALECCEPKLCGHHFFDSDKPQCNENTHTLNPRNQPCVDCDQSDCCTEIEVPTLKCAEILIPNGQAFYSEPAGPGSARSKGSVLRVECDLGFKSQGAEYLYSDDLVSRDQSPDVDHPVCDPVLIEQMIEGHVEVYSPTTSGWNRAPPVCRAVSCPLLQVQSLHTPDHKGPIGKVIYRDAQMDEIPGRGAGYGPRDYAAEADVVCNEGWIRVPNVCVEDAGDSSVEKITNTLEWGLKGYWKFEENTEDNSPHCVSSRGSTSDGLGTCNDGAFNGTPEYTDGVPMENDDANKALVYDGTSHYVEVDDDSNMNWSSTNPNELDLETDQWTASLWVNLAADQLERDSYLFARYNRDYEEVAAIKLNDGYVGVIYNNNQENPRSTKPLEEGKWISILVRCFQQTIDLFVDGTLVASHDFPREDEIWDTPQGYVFIGADKEGDRAGTVNQYFHGAIDEVRYYTRGLTDQEILCISQKRSVCPRGAYYAKPYNTQGCNRESEELGSFKECQDAVKELLQDSVLGNSLNGGSRFNRQVEDEQPRAATDTPTKCSYRESDSQVMWNPNPTGRAHTSLAPICKRTPSGQDLHTVGCLPKCLENGKWTVDLPTCEKDWCNPVHAEWGCCEHRTDKMSQDYWLKHHKQRNAKCPIGYGDCNNDDECTKEGVRGLCSQRRDLDNVDLCIVDMDPCFDESGVSNALCCAWTAVGGDYKTATNTHIASRLFFGGVLVILGSLTGFYLFKGPKGEEHRYLLEEEL